MSVRLSRWHVGLSSSPRPWREHNLPDQCLSLLCRGRYLTKGSFRVRIFSASEYSVSPQASKGLMPSGCSFLCFRRPFNFFSDQRALFSDIPFRILISLLSFTDRPWSHNCEFVEKSPPLNHKVLSMSVHLI